MNDYWIKTSLEQKGTLCLSKVGTQYRADMHWPNDLEVLGLPKDTPAEAINSLEEELLEDATKLMQLSGCV